MSAMPLRSSVLCNNEQREHGGLRQTAATCSFRTWGRFQEGGLFLWWIKDFEPRTRPCRSGFGAPSHIRRRGVTKALSVSDYREPVAERAHHFLLFVRQAMDEAAKTASFAEKERLLRLAAHCLRLAEIPNTAPPVAGGDEGDARTTESPQAGEGREGSPSSQHLCHKQPGE